MKFKAFLIGCLSFGVASGSFAQVEYDDLYFNAKDRSELNAMEASGSLTMTGKKKSMLQDDFNENPTDSYSARNINPEHVSRANSKAAQEDETDYFINDYQQSTASGYSNWSSGFDNWYNSPWYSAGWYGPRFSSWNSPYYSPFYSYMGSPYSAWSSPYYDPFYDPFYGPYSYGYGGGSYWNVGLGLSYSFGSPYNYYPMSMRPWGWGAGYHWYNSWYPRTTVVIVDNNVNGRNVSYGKRPTRDSRAYTNTTAPTRSRDNVNVPTYGRSNSTGRTTTTTAPTSTRQEPYYNKNWRSASQGSATRPATYRSYNDRSGGSNTRSSGYNPGSSYNRDSGPSYTPSSTPQRSYNPGGSAPSRSTGSGTNGRTRGSH